MTATRRNVYLDHSATTPTDPRVVESMLPYFTEYFGNSSSAHTAGRKAESAIEDARADIAMVLHCEPDEIVFTSGGTESDNLAIRGAGWHMREAGRARLVTTTVEHSAVGKTIEQMRAHLGFAAEFLAVDSTARINLDDVTALPDDTALVSIIYANNEVGTVERLAQIADRAHARGALVHTDAVQAAGQLTLDVTALGVDLMSLSAHKFYGPKGVGALYVRSGIDLLPAQSGGSHESGRRGGTTNTPGIVGMARALTLAYEENETRLAHYQARRDQLIDGVCQRVSGVELTGHPVERLPSHASFIIDGVDSNRLLMHLDLKGVMASSASACKTGNPEPSGVLLAMGYPRARALGSLRMTVGRTTSEADIDYAVETLARAVERVRTLNE